MSDGKGLFKGFGEFDSAEEINMAAEGLKKEGDTDSLYKLAKENGIDREDVKDYLNGDMPELASVYTAALGKLEVELKAASNKMVMGVIVEMTKQMCQELQFASAVRRKGMYIQDIYDLIYEGAKKHKKGNCGASCGTDRQLQGIIMAYYLEGRKAAGKKVEELY